MNIPANADSAVTRYLLLFSARIRLDQSESFVITRWLFLKIILQLRRSLNFNMHAANKSLRRTYTKDYTFKFLYICIKTRTVTRFVCCIKAIAVFGPRSAPYRNNISSTISSWKYLLPGKEKEEWMKGGGVEERKKAKHSVLFAMFCSGHMREYMDASEGLFQRIRSI